MPDGRFACPVSAAYRISTTSWDSNHDAAWFAKNRNEIREQLGFWLGIALSGTSYKE
jgi:hypothetical protein